MASYSEVRADPAGLKRAKIDGAVAERSHLSGPVIDVDAIVDEVLREDIEDFDIRSSLNQPLQINNGTKGACATSRTSALIKFAMAAPAEAEHPPTKDHDRNHNPYSDWPEHSETEEYFEQAADPVAASEPLEPSFVLLEEEGRGGDSSSVSEGDGQGAGEYSESVAYSESDSDGFGEEDEFLHFSELGSDAGSEAGAQSEHSPEQRSSSAAEIAERVTAVGPIAFVEEQVANGCSPDTLLEALGCPIPEGLIRAELAGKWAYAKRYLFKHVYERQRLPELGSLEDVVGLIERAQKILVLTGAGISVSCGIPDFRSEGGLYSQIQDKFALPEPECMFDIEFFRIDPEPFYTFAKELLPSESVRPSFSHYFVSALQRREKLLRLFTQNIDTLEKTAGIDRVVYCHGSLMTASCLECQLKIDFEQLKNAMSAELVVCCKACGSVVKPDIVFFGEPLPAEFDRHLATDCREADLVLVIGSSLKVHPFSSIPDLIAPRVPQILINRESLDHTFDIELLGDCDLILAELSHRLGWFGQVCELSGSRSSLLEARHPSQLIPPSFHIFPGAQSVRLPANQPARLAMDGDFTEASQERHGQALAED